MFEVISLSCNDQDYTQEISHLNMYFNCKVLPQYNAKTIILNAGIQVSVCSLLYVCESVLMFQYSGEQLKQLAKSEGG